MHTCTMHHAHMHHAPCTHAPCTMHTCTMHHAPCTGTHAQCHAHFQPQASQCHDQHHSAQHTQHHQPWPRQHPLCTTPPPATPTPPAHLELALDGQLAGEHAQVVRQLLVASDDDALAAVVKLRAARAAKDLLHVQHPQVCEGALLGVVHLCARGAGWGVSWRGVRGTSGG